MNATTRKTALMGALLVVAMAAASTARADAPVFLDPSSGGALGNPIVFESTLGISYQLIPGYGYEVVRCAHGSRAQRIGFEPGDIILSIDGWRLSHHGGHEPGFRQAVCDGGWFWFAVRDVRTGRVISRWANLYH